MKKYHAILFLTILLNGYKVNADVPLSLENIITDKNKLKLDYSVTYANSSNTENTLDKFILLQTGAASFVNIPTTIRNKNNIRDTVIGTFGIRYGIADKTEIYSRSTFLNDRVRINENPIIKQSTSKWEDH